MIMKNNIKFLALIAIVMISSFAVAEETPRKTFADYQVGDTVVIRDDNTVYLTGEKPSSWVYGKKFTIMQKGTKRFPEGLLIKEIYSWIDSYYLGLEEKEEPVQQEETEEEKAARLAGQKKGAVGGEKEEQPQDTVPVQPQDTVPAQPQDTVPVQPKDTVVSQPQDTVPAQPQDTVQKQGPVNQGAAETVEEKKKKENVDLAYATYGSLTQKMDRFSIGIRGGAASLMQKENDKSDWGGKWNLGYDALLDLQYAHYFGAKFGKKVNHGILTGVSIGWAQSGWNSDVVSDTTVTTEAGKVDYSINAKGVKEKDGQLMLEIPLMYSMITSKGFFLNVGPKIQIPVWSHYNQNIAEADVKATLQDYGVTLDNEAVMGLVQDNQVKTKGKWSNSKLKVMLSADLGYEWFFREKNSSLGLGVFANYSLFDLYKNNNTNQLVGLDSAPTATKDGVLNVFSATDSYNDRLGYFDAGVKLIYHFNFFK